MRRPARAIVAVLVTLICVATLTGVSPNNVASGLASPADAAPEACARNEIGNSTPVTTGQNATRRPVVFVHGWTGKPLTDLAGAIYNDFPSSVSVFSFDYSNWSAYWASDDHIAPCLAAYLAGVSNAFKSAGGDGRIIYVAHSMGGLAIRYAMDPTKVNDAVTAAQVPWLITVDTPHLGSAWGGLGAAQAFELFNGVLGKDVPNPFGVDGGRCLALHDKGSELAASCDGLPPWLPGGTTLYEIAGAITVQRTFLGVHLYDIPLASDGIVDASSSRGYLTSGPGGIAPVVSSPTVGTTVHSQEVDCDVSSGQLGGAVKTLKGTLASADVPVELLTDWGALQNLQADSHTPLTLGLDAAALFVATCSHIHITSDPDTVEQIATDIATIAKANPAVAKPSGRWTDSTVVITGNSLGAVTRGMSLAQASAAAGVTIDEGGDGEDGNETVPNLSILAIQGQCFVAGNYDRSTPKVVTPDGFALGQTVDQLKAIYGSRLAYTAGTVTTGNGYLSAGQRINVGYFVHDSGGLLFFQTENFATSGAIRIIVSESDGPLPHCSYS